MRTYRGTYPPEEFVIYLDDDEAAVAPRVVTPAEIAAMDGKIKIAMRTGVFADGFASNDEIDDGWRRRDVRADGAATGSAICTKTIGMARVYRRSATAHEVLAAKSTSGFSSTRSLAKGAIRASPPLQR
jgi:hypothetical protein